MANERWNGAGRQKPCSLLLSTALAVGVWVVVGRAEANTTTSPVMQAGAELRAGGSSAVETVPAPGRQAIVGRRDPFKLPGPPGPGLGPGEGIIPGGLPPGKRGLVIALLRLEGVVRLDNTNEMIAVVDTDRNRAYFLRENDEVFNGVVSRITPDSVYFRENYLDQGGRVQTREIVKRLGQGAGEGR